MTGLARALGERLVRDEPLSRHTAARIGGLAELYIIALASQELCEFVRLARQHDTPCIVLGCGSNVLVSDAGVRGLVIANKTKNINYQTSHAGHSIQVQAESGVALPTLARECIERGYANLEWAAGVPGTVGGAVVGNAGAHGGDVARDLITASILDANGAIRDWANAELEFGYRTSKLKIPNTQKPVVLAATFQLRPSARQELETLAAGFAERRKRSQPPGATMGSVFRNPPGDYAGRLIEAAGLKGARVGAAQISPLHANFIVNLGGATAADVKALIDLAREKVQSQFGIELELEIEMIGKW